MLIVEDIGEQVNVGDGKVTVTLTLLSPLEPPALEQFKVKVLLAIIL